MYNKATNPVSIDFGQEGMGLIQSPTVLFSNKFWYISQQKPVKIVDPVTRFYRRTKEFKINI